MAHNRKISVIGLGYVGLPVAAAFGRKQRTIGFDIDARRIQELKDGHDRTNEVNDEDLRRTDIHYTCDAADLTRADFHIVAVPTPIDAAKQPDLKPVLRASETVGKILKKGDIVVYESTVYPGATEEECVPILERESGLTCGTDFFIGYSPERINPGDKQHSFTTIVKVVSGQNEEILGIVADVYGSVVKAGVYRAPSIRVAEAAKVIENTQRDLNIALMNELALIFDKMNIDTRDVLAAAGSKWNFLPFEPGLVGGHCIGVDPYYLTYKASILGYAPQVILAGRSINDGMGKYVGQQVIKSLIKSDCNVKDSTVTVLGVTFKENVPDLRNTRVIDIVHELREYSVNVQVHDPLADADEAYEEYRIRLTPLNELRPANAVVLAVAHDEYLKKPWQLIGAMLTGESAAVIDVKAKLPRDGKPGGIALYRL